MDIRIQHLHSYLGVLHIPLDGMWKTVDIYPLHNEERLGKIQVISVVNYAEESISTDIFVQQLK